MRHPSTSTARDNPRDETSITTMAFFSYPLPFLLLLLLPLLSASSSSSSSSSSFPPPSPPNITINDILPLYALPRGLFPSSVTSFSHDGGTGSLHLNLSAPCYLHPDRILYYHRHIHAYLHYGSLSALSGIQASFDCLFWTVWFDVHTIMVDMPPPYYFIHFDGSWFKRFFHIDHFYAVYPCFHPPSNHFTPPRTFSPNFISRQK